MKEQYENLAIYLIGFPGTGKLTVAKEIEKRGNFHLVDNHFINNVVFSLIKTDGITPLTSKVWENVEKVRECVLDTIQNVSPPEYSFILTNHLDNSDFDRALYDKIHSCFSMRNSLFVPIVLHCDIEEHKKRITSDERRNRLKEICKNAPNKYRDKGEIKFDHPNKLELDISNISARKSADLIFDHLHNLMQ